MNKRNYRKEAIALLKNTAFALLATWTIVFMFALNA